MPGGRLAVRQAQSGVLSAWIAALLWIPRQLERRRARLALLELSDEQLKDIGLSRGEAFGLARGRTSVEALRRNRE